MPIYALGAIEPRIHPDAFVHPDAVVIGDVEIGPDSSIWPCAVLRGDNGGIRIGARTSIHFAYCRDSQLFTASGQLGFGSGFSPSGVRQKNPP